MEKSTDRVRKWVSTFVDNAAIVAGVVALIAIVVTQSPKGTGENERERAARVIEQCWKSVANSTTTPSGAPVQPETCRRMERGFKEQYGSK